MVGTAIAALFVIVFVPLVLSGVIGMIPDGTWSRLAGRKRVDDALARAVVRLGGTGGLGAYHAYTKTLPAFRFPDLHRALDALSDRAEAAEPWTPRTASRWRRSWSGSSPSSGCGPSDPPA